MRAAFTLIELAIAITIIGLVVGGVLAGQELIRAGHVRAVTNEEQRYVTAVQNFRAKYTALPGDMKNATALWGKDNANCTTDTGTAATDGTCNGNNDAMMTAGSGASATSELYQFWKQLGAAGLINGYFTGIAGAGGALDSTIGTNVPASKFTGAGWSVYYLSSYAGDASAYALDYGNFFVVGFKTAASLTDSPAFTPADAYNLDSKVDDGKPASGSVVARFWNGACASADSGATANSNFAASYRLSDNTTQCALYFVKAF